MPDSTTLSLSERAADVFGGGAAPEEPPVDLKALHAKIGPLTLCMAMGLA